MLDAGGLRQQRIQIAIFIDELRGGLDADAFRAGHIIRRIARERLHVDNLVGRHAEIIDDIRLSDDPLLARAGRGVIHHHTGTDELHQILVGGDDQHIGAFRARLRRIGRDKIVGFINVLLDRRHAEGAHGRAHQGKLWDEVIGRIAAIGLVFGKDFLAERVLALVEDDGEMGGRHARSALAHELQDLRAEKPYGARRQPIGAVVVFRVLPDRLEKGAKDEGRAVDEKDVASGANGFVHGAHEAIVTAMPPRCRSPAKAGWAGEGALSQPRQRRR